jgi:hypothetical protein
MKIYGFVNATVVQLKDFSFGVNTFELKTTTSVINGALVILNIAV